MAAGTKKASTGDWISAFSVAQCSFRQSGNPKGSRNANNALLYSRTKDTGIMWTFQSKRRWI